MSEHTIWNEIGTLHFNAGSYDQASRAYLRAIEVGGGEIAKQNLALSYVKAFQPAKAVPVYEEVIATLPDGTEKANLWQQVGELYEQMNQPEKAAQAYRFAEREMPNAEALKSQQAALMPRSTLTEISLFDGLSIDGAPQAERDDDLEPNAGDKPATVVETKSHPKDGTLMHVNIEQVFVNPVQPRLHIDVAYLAESIREYGIIQPLIVTPNGKDDRYILVSGERRLKAARQVGLDQVPVIVREIDELQRLKLALVENVQRRDLSVLEQAEAYEQLRDTHQLSEHEIAKLIGRSSVVVRNLLHLLEMPEKIRRALDSGRISEEHARALFLLGDDSLQQEALQQVLDDELSVRKTKSLVRAMLRENLAEIEEIQQPDEEEAEVPAEAVEYEEAAPLAEEPASPEVPEEIEENVVLGEVVEEDLSDETPPAPVNEEEDDEHEEEEEEEHEEEGWDQGLSNLDVPEESFEPALPQTVNLDDPEAPLSDEQVRNRMLTFKRVTEVNPENDKAWSKLGHHYAHLGDTDAAIEAYLKAVELAPAISEYHEQLGQAYLAARDFEGAADALEKVVELNDENAFARCALASCYRHLDREEEAQMHLDIVAPVMRHEKVYNQACFEAIRGNVVASVELLERALAQGEATIEKIQRDSDFDFIRDNSLFTSLLEEKQEVSAF